MQSRRYPHSEPTTHLEFSRLYSRIASLDSDLSLLQRNYAAVQGFIVGGTANQVFQKTSADGVPAVYEWSSLAASSVGYTPADVTDWTGGVDPGDVDDALDQLADRVAALASAGYVVGPASATDNAFARYDLTTGKLIQNSVVICTDAGAVSGMDSLSFANNKQVRFGTSDRHTISSDGTNLVINPDNFGSGFVSVTGALYAEYMAAGTSLPDPTRSMTFGASGTTVVGGILGSLEYDGSGNVIYASQFSATYQGSDSNPTAYGGYFSSIMRKAIEAASVGISTNYFDARLLVDQSEATATVALVAGWFQTADDSGASSAGICPAIGVYVGPAFSDPGFTSYLPIGVVANAGLLIPTGDRLYFEGSAATPQTLVIGDTYITSPTGAEIEMYVGAVERFDLSATGLRIKANASTALPNTVGVLMKSITAVGNVGTGTDDLISQTMVASVLNVNGDTIVWEAFGITTNSADTKQIDALIGGTNVVSSGALTISVAWEWKLRVRYVRTGAATQDVFASFEATSSAGVTLAIHNFVTTAHTLSSTVIFKCTGAAGAAAANNVIVQEESELDFHPMP